MIDLIMIALILGCCNIIHLLIRWCQKQVDSND